MLRIKKTLTECERLLKDEFKSSSRDYDGEIDAKEKQCLINYNDRVETEIIEEKKRQELKEIEDRNRDMFQQSFFHGASPIPHNYFNQQQWNQVKFYCPNNRLKFIITRMLIQIIRKFILSVTPKSSKVVSLFLSRQMLESFFI